MIAKWSHPYLLLDICIISSHHIIEWYVQIQGNPIRVGHMLSVPLTSSLSACISDNPESKALQILVGYQVGSWWRHNTYLIPECRQVDDGDLWEEHLTQGSDK